MANLSLKEKDLVNERKSAKVFAIANQQHLLEKRLDRAMERARITKDFSQVDELEKQQEEYALEVKELMRSPSVLEKKLKRSGDSGGESVLGGIVFDLSGATAESPLVEVTKKRKKSPPSSITTSTILSSGGEDH